MSGKVPMTWQRGVKTKTRKKERGGSVKSLHRTPGKTAGTGHGVTGGAGVSQGEG